MILLRLAIKDLVSGQDTLSTLRGAHAWAPNSYPMTGVSVSRLVEVSGMESLEIDPPGDSGKFVASAKHGSAA
jgi:hypothetical protein